ncbi:MAG: flagellar hook-associated protein FlgL [Planctomycetota bacterium]|nr:flagellar hook-associated protein FlgL [Planctomycetota bacterium]
MAILPLQLARVSNTLRTTLTQQSITRTQRNLAQVQNELATGKRINVPSDDPGDAAMATQLRRMLDQHKTFSQNLQFAGSQLSEVDSTLGGLGDLVQQAIIVAQANLGSDVSDTQRSEAANIVQNLYQQAINLGNRQFRGMYLFGGDQGDQAPFVSESGGIKFVGSSRVLSNAVDVGTTMPFMVDGNEVFGALSTRVRGDVDLSGRLTLDTRLSDVRGATGDGVRLGTFQLSNGTLSANVDLANADTIGNVITAINTAAVGGITASIAADGNSLLLSGGPTESISVADFGTGTAAADLGIRTSTPAGPGVSLDGQTISPIVTPLTRLADLRNSLGIDTASGIIIGNGPKTATISLAAATTVQDLINAINDSGTGVFARINDAANGIDVINPTQGLSMTIAENGGTTAADLGVRSFGPNSPLSELNGGKGVRTVAGDDIQITRRNGTTLSVDLNSAKTIQDVIDAINAADAGGGVAASFATTGNGIVLTDSTGAAGTLAVAPVNFSMAADDLGLRASTSANTLTGTDVNAVQTPGLFGNLAKLRDALTRSDQQAITEAAEGLEKDLKRVVCIRGQVGARIQDINSRQDRIDEQNLTTQSLLSTLEDTDYTEAITRFQTLQMALQANLQTAGKVLNLSLLDFLT